MSDDDKSYIRNCVLDHRPGETLFRFVEGGLCYVQLDGYRIEPKELRGDETQSSINAWQRTTFGETTAWHAFERMQWKWDELSRAMHTGPSFTMHEDTEARRKAREECADLYITLCRVAEQLGLDLHAEVDRKMAINRKREWVVDAIGNGQHVPEEGEG